MKIALLKSHFASFGGLEKYTIRLAEQFVLRGCDVTLLTTASEKVPAIGGVKTITLGDRSKLSFLQLLNFDRASQKWLQQNPMDSIFGMERNRFQTHYRPGSGVHAVFLKQRKLTDSLLKRGSFFLNPLHLLLLKMEKEAFESPRLKKIYPNSEMVKKELLENFALSEEKIEVIHNGVEWSSFREPFEESFDKENPIENFKLDRKKHIFLFIGNGYKRKGLSFLIEGLALLKKDNFHLLVVGKEKNLPLYEALVAKHKLESSVSFFGPKSPITPFYQVADTLVLPTIYDPFANVTLEALAMGLFVVTSHYNGAKEILNEECGTIIQDLSSPESVKKSLEIALSRPKTRESAIKLRETIKRLDFSIQLNKIVDSVIN